MAESSCSSNVRFRDAFATLVDVLVPATGLVLTITEAVTAELTELWTGEVLVTATCGGVVTFLEGRCAEAEDVFSVLGRSSDVLVMESDDFFGTFKSVADFNVLLVLAT